MSQRTKILRQFILDSARCVVSGPRPYIVMIIILLAFMGLGGIAFGYQLQQGLAVTGMSDHIGWGFYISNFTFFVGIAAAAVMVVMPAYVLSDLDFSKAVMIGEAIAVAALSMCLTFVIVDLGSPERMWHLIPAIGSLNWPSSILAWDIIVLNGYLLLNLGIPFYLLLCKYTDTKPNIYHYVPFVFISVFWAFGLHLVTAFLYAGLKARPFWHSALLGPRFLASAFAAGPALMILVLSLIRRFTDYQIQMRTIGKLLLITTVAAQINLLMLASEFFVEMYAPTEHSESARYLFFGLDGHAPLTPMIWFAISLNIIATAVLSIHRLRKKQVVLKLACAALFSAIWLEKGLGLIVPGFIPSPIGEVYDYFPTIIELTVSLGIFAMGAMILIFLIKVGLAIELGKIKYRPLI